MVFVRVSWRKSFAYFSNVGLNGTDVSADRWHDRQVRNVSTASHHRHADLSVHRTLWNLPTRSLRRPRDRLHEMCRESRLAQRRKHLLRVPRWLQRMRLRTKGCWWYCDVVFCSSADVTRAVYLLRHSIVWYHNNYVLSGLFDLFGFLIFIF